MEEVVEEAVVAAVEEGEVAQRRAQGAPKDLHQDFDTNNLPENKQ